MATEKHRNKKLELAAASAAAITLLAMASPVFGKTIDILMPDENSQANSAKPQEQMVVCNMPTNLPKSTEVVESNSSPQQPQSNQVQISGVVPIFYQEKIVPISQCIVTPKY